jgi:hypothetical protein
VQKKGERRESGLKSPLSLSPPHPFPQTIINITHSISSSRCRDAVSGDGDGDGDGEYSMLLSKEIGSTIKFSHNASAYWRN